MPRTHRVYESDLERFDRATVETARGVLTEVPGGVATFEPFNRYPTRTVEIVGGVHAGQ